MTTKPITVNLALTVQQLALIVQELKDRYTAHAYAVDPTPYPPRDDNDGFVDKEGRVSLYRVHDAEQALAKRAELASLIATLWGEELLREEPGVIGRIANARQRLDEQTLTEAQQAE